MSNLYNSSTYLTDLDEVIKQYDILQKFENKSILITGSTGLICSAIADLLLRASENTGNIKVYCAGRNISDLQMRFNKFSALKNLCFLYYDVSESIGFDCKVDYIVHGAGNAYPALMQNHPVETLLQNIIGVKHILDYAQKTGAINTVYISSSEVYGKLATGMPLSDDVYGAVDILNSRSCYPNGKRAAETLCVSYLKEYDVPVTIVRPGHIYGPTARRKDNRVSSQFAYDAAEGKNLILKSDGAQIRSYCYMLDCATAILEVLLNGDKGAAYNISNKESIMSIRALTELYARWGNVKVLFDLPDQNEEAQFNPMNNSSLESTRLEALGWRGSFNAERGTEHTIRILKEIACSVE